MNLLHQWRCSSRRWQAAVAGDRMPWTLEGLHLGSDVLELGPGYGAGTGFLRERVPRLTCVEVDPKLAERLRQRPGSAGVEVLCEDAGQMSFPDGSFDAAVCFMMLHHVPSPELQDRLLREVARVLRPGGVLAGNEGLDSWLFRAAHLRDTFVPLDPGTLGERLRAAGFQHVEVDLRRTTFRFRATKPRTVS